MTATLNATVKCPFCSWCKRTYTLPAHLIAHHVTEIRLRPVRSDHCVYGYVIDKGEEIGFCACLSCDRGTLCDGVSGNGSRWVELHAKRSECKKEHRKLLAELKEAIGVPVAPAPVPTPVAPPINSVSALWEKLRSMSQLAPFMKEIERTCKEFHDEGRFDAEEGFETTIKAGVGYRKESSKYTEEKEKMEQTHESMIQELRNELTDLRYQVRGLQSENKQQAAEIVEMRKRITVLERENNRYRELYPPLPPEDPV
jgi:hypothetical protein